jgi:hypothetical protein
VAEPTDVEVADRYTRRALLLIRYANYLNNPVDAALADLALKLAKLLRGAGLQDITPRPLAALLREAEAEITTTFGTIAETQQAALVDLVTVEAEFAQAAGNASTVASRTAIENSLNRLLVQGRPLAEQWAHQGEQLLWKLSSEVATAANSPTAETVANTVLGTGPNMAGGLMEAAQAQAATLTSTAVDTAAYAGRLATFRASGVNALKFFAILDSRTTIGCAVRAGKLYTLDLEPIGHDVVLDRPPPRHWKCRSILLPMKFPDGPPEDGGKEKDNFARWLSKHSDAEQDDMLGPRRAQLYRDGKITLADLIGQRGQELTLAELKAAKL